MRVNGTRNNWAKPGTVWLGLLLVAVACKGQGRAPSSGASAKPALQAPSAAPSASANAPTAAGSAEPAEPPPEPLREPLLIAVVGSDIATVKRLLVEHADVAVKEGKRSAIVLAAQTGNLAMVTLLLGHKVPKDQAEDALVYASGAGNVALMKVFLDKKVSPSATSPGGISPLILAGYAGKLAAVQLQPSGAAHAWG